MTLQDEARDLLRQKRAAEDELTAARREIDETVADGGGHVDKPTADLLAARLKAAQERLRRVVLAIAALNADDGTTTKGPTT